MLGVWCCVCDAAAVMRVNNVGCVMLSVCCWVCDVECVMLRVWCGLCDFERVLLSVWCWVCDGECVVECVRLSAWCWMCELECLRLSVWWWVRCVERGILSVWCWRCDVAGVMLSVWCWVCGTSRLPQRTFSTSLSPKVKTQGSKTSIFHGTFTKSGDPSCQNEHFPRDFWQTRTSRQTPYIKNPYATARFNTSKTSLWHCKFRCKRAANVSLSRNPAPAQRHAPRFCGAMSLPALYNVIPTHIRLHEKCVLRAPPQSWIRAVASGWLELRNNAGRTQLYPQSPRLKENPFRHIWEKNNNQHQHNN